MFARVRSPHLHRAAHRVAAVHLGRGSENGERLGEERSLSEELSVGDRVSAVNRFPIANASKSAA